VARSFLHPSTHHGRQARGESPIRVVTGGCGVRIEDRDGNRLPDGFAGLYRVNVGCGRTEIADAVAAQAREPAYCHAYVGHGTEAAITLARMIAEPPPAHMNHTCFGLPFAAAHILDDKTQEAACVAAMRAFNARFSMTMLEIDSGGMYDGAVEAQGNTLVTTELGGGGTATARSTDIASRCTCKVWKNNDFLPACPSSPRR
jgi:hypothetical protein